MTKTKTKKINKTDRITVRLTVSQRKKLAAWMKKYKATEGAIVRELIDATPGKLR